MFIRRQLMAACLVICFLISSAGTALAIGFADLQEAPWARPHIERMSDKGVVSGSDHPVTGQRVYRPNSPVTKVETIVMLYSVLQKTNQLTSTTDYSSKYNGILVSGRIPDWARRQVAYGLESGVITTADLARFMRDGTPDPVQQPASREEVAVYFGRTLENQGHEVEGPIRLSFLDTESIGSEALPYVHQLVSLNIVSGDNENRFNPRNTITRAEMAALLNKTYDLLLQEEIVVIEVPSIVDPDEPIGTVIRREEGTIRRVNYDSGQLIVEMKNSFEPEILAVTANTKIMINSIQQGLIQLKDGAEGEFTFDDKDRLLRIEINPRGTLFTGTLRTITPIGNNYTMEVESAVNRNDIRSFRVTDSTEIILQSRLSSPTALKADDFITVRYEGVDALAIEDNFQSVETEIDGILDEAISFSRFPYVLKLRQLNNQIKEYEVDPDVRVNIDNKRGYLEELMRGDIVILRLDPQTQRVTRVDAIAFNVKRTIEGRIVEIRLARPNQITILKADRTEETFDLAEGVEIFIDNQRSTLSDLKVDTEVTLEFEGGRVIEIEADRVASGDEFFTGTITRFHDSSSRIVINRLSTQTGRHEDMSVHFSNRTVVRDINGREISVNGLRRDDRVWISGYYARNDFIAERIFVIE